MQKIAENTKSLYFGSSIHQVTEGNFTDKTKNTIYCERVQTIHALSTGTSIN